MAFQDSREKVLGKKLLWEKRNCSGFLSSAWTHLCPSSWSDHSFSFATPFFLATFKGIRVRATDTRSLEGLSARSDRDRGVHQGVCADVGRLSLSGREGLLDTEEGADHHPSRRLLLLLCGVKDPMNLGAVLRSAYFLGAEAVITTPEYPSASPTPGIHNLVNFTLFPILHLAVEKKHLKKHIFYVAVVSKASSGVLEVFPPASVSSASDFLEKSREAGWRVFGADCSVDNSEGEGEASNSHCDGDDGSTAVLVLGSEGAGLPQDLRPLCHSGPTFLKAFFYLFCNWSFLLQAS